MQGKTNENAKTEADAWRIIYAAQGKNNEDLLADLLYALAAKNASGEKK